VTWIIFKEIFQCLVRVISSHELSHHLIIWTQHYLISATDSVINAHLHYSSLINQLGHYARVVDHLAILNVAQGAPLGGGSTLHHSIKLRLKQVFQSVYRHELETRLSHKPWKQEIAKITDWPRRKEVAEFWLCVGRDCLGTHLHCIGIRTDPYCMLCSLCEPMDRNHLGQCTALLNRTECERYWEARTKMMENWLCLFTITIFVTTSYH